MLQADNNPWLGLASYEYNDAYRFFGREEELSELKTAICNNLFTTIYGISGAGKTSLINAGMMPLLEKEGYLPVRVRLDHKSKIGYNTQIIKAIVSTLENFGGEVETENVIDQENISENERLWNFLFTSKFWSKSNHQVIPVIFIDQFEEIFTNNDSEETIRDFFEVINSLQYNNPPTNTSSYLTKYEKYVDYNDVAQLRIVLIMREDFLARLEDYSFNIPALRKNRRGIKRMNGLQALEVIQKPMPAIVTRNVAIHMLGKVTGKITKDSPQDLARLSVDTSILSLFCSELYQKAVLAQQSILTEELVGQFGDNIISSFYDETMGLVSSKTMEYLESHLLTYSGFRNSVALEDLEQNGIKKVELTRLTEKRLIRIETVDGIDRVEFTHDVLCGVANMHRNLRLQKTERKSDMFYYGRFILETTFSSVVLVYGLYSMYICRSWFVGAIPKLLPAFLISICAICYIYKFGIKGQRRNYFKIGFSYLLLFLSSSLIMGPWTLINLYNNIVRNENFANAYFSLCMPALLVFIAIFLHAVYMRISYKNVRNLSLLFWSISLCILLEYRFRLLFLFLAFVFVFIESPYCFKRDNNYWKFCLLGIVCDLLYLTFVLKWDPWELPIMVALYLFVIMLYSFFSYKRNRDIDNAIDYCFSLHIYREYPFLRKYVQVLFALISYAMLYLIGLRLSDIYTIVLTPILCCLLVSILADIIIGKRLTASNGYHNRSTTVTFVGEKKDFVVIKYYLYILFTVVGVLIFQYFIGHIYYMIFFWIISILFVCKLCLYLINKRYIHPHNKYVNLLKCFAVWVGAVFIGTLMGMGYNVFTLPQYARTWGETQSNRPVLKFLTIENSDGFKGIRDRNSLVVPVKYKSVILSSNASADFVENIGFPYSLEKKYVEKRNSPKFADGRPVLMFITESIDGMTSQSYWKCSDHLDIDNICTDIYAKYYKFVIDNNVANGFDSWFEQDEEAKYVDYLLHIGMDSVMTENVVKKLFVNSLNNRSISYPRHPSQEATMISPFASLEDLKTNFNKVEANVFYECLREKAELFAKSKSINLSRLLIDTLLVNCKNYNNSDLIKYSELSQFRIYARDFDMACKDAESAVLKKERYGIVRQIESLYLQGRVDDAINLLTDNKRNKIPVETDSYPNSEDDINDYYKYLGDQVWQDINEYVGLGILRDTLSQSFNNLKQCLLEESKTPDYDYAEPMDHFRYVDVKTYWLNKNIELYTKGRNFKKEYYFLKQNGQMVSPCIFSFSLPVDNAISIIIDAKDTKRKYLDFYEYTPKLMEKSYDHAWRFSEGLAAVSVNNKIGFINENGSFVIQPQYPYPQYDYHETYLTYGDNQIRLDKYNNIRVDFVFEQGQCRMNGNNNKFGIIDKHGNWIVRPIYDKIGELRYGHRQVKLGDKYGLIDIRGTVVIPIEYNFKDISFKEKGWTVNSIPLDKVLTKK